MATKIFVNLPVKDLNRSVEFFTKLGFSFNAQFTDETATSMIVSDDIFVMLLTHEKFKTFTPKEICDATKSTEVLVCLSSQSREEVDEMVRKAVTAGGTTYNESPVGIKGYLGTLGLYLLFSNVLIYPLQRKL